MEYIFGRDNYTGDEVLKTKGKEHTDLIGFVQTVRETDLDTTTDNFYVVRKVRSAEDAEGNCYDWYVIDKHNTILDSTKRVSAEMSEISDVSAIAFVKMAENGDIDDVTAGEHTSVFSPWEPDVDYQTGNMRKHDDKLYRCLQDHRSQADWTPDVAVSLWVNVSDPAEEWPEWSQPIGAHDAYNTGDKVSHNEKHWVSSVDSNVWEPGVYGWDEA